jgi:hypothetical protein
MFTNPKPGDQVFAIDLMSEFVGAGHYCTNKTAFPKAIAASFDSIAIDAGTKVKIFSQPNFEGSVLYERTGPCVVTNTKWKGSFRDWEAEYTSVWDQPFESVFPRSVREFSSTDMHQWDSGSCIISVGEPIPEWAKNVSGYSGL